MTIDMPPPVPQAPTDQPAPVPAAPTSTVGVRLRDNPVLRHELIERVQGARAVVFLTIWLVLLTGILVLAYQGSVAVNQGFGGDVGSLGRVGRELFEWVLFGMVVLVMFLVPGLTAGSITGERERQTLVPLQMTLMRPRDIVVGKLAAALAFLVFLVLAAMPLLAVSLLVGGVRILDMVRGIGMLLFTGTVLGSVGVWISSRFKRTTAATVVTYAVAAIFSFGSFVSLATVAIIDASSGNDEVTAPVELLAFNPVAGIADALPSVGNGFVGDTITPFGGMRGAIGELDGSDNFDENGFRVDDGDQFIWLMYLGIGLIVMAISVWRASNNVRTPSETER
jgi:ABC-type transport system involved in multi-copper enzyme maturation permease subunit